jgi:hypothetical protein
MRLNINTRKNLIIKFLIILVSLPLLSFGQLGSTMYGLHRQMNPSTVSLVEIDPTTGVMTPVGNQVLSTTVNTTGVSLFICFRRQRIIRCHCKPSKHNRRLQ